jgi:hypothetical protein
MDESVEEDVVEEIKEQIVEEVLPATQPENTALENIPAPQTQELESQTSKLTFNDIDYVKSYDGNEDSISAPKNVERLEQISEMRAQQRRDENDDENEKLTITDQEFNLDSLDVHNIEEPRIDLLPDLLLDDIEVLD